MTQNEMQPTNPFPSPHYPALEKRVDGNWNVFCAQCSHDNMDYIYPCKLGYWSDIPPNILTAK